MEYQTMEMFFSDLRNYHILSTPQQENVSRLTEISEKFHTKAGIRRNDDLGKSSRIIVLESGHQPNFFPYSGTWKKAFLLDRIRKSLIREGGDPAVAFFGLADQNISTARLLSKNQIPALNKNGYLKIGFKIKEENKSRSFNHSQKPSADQWQGEIDKIGQYYHTLSKKNKIGDEFPESQLEQIFHIMWKSYDLAENFAELNALVFAKICREIFNLDLSFFLYSDMHKEKMFLQESGTVLRNLESFNRIYNSEIAEKGLDIPMVPHNHLPFWYECECGEKLDLFIDDSGTCKVTCSSCKKNYNLSFDNDFANLWEYFGSMDFNAVSRNIIMAEGLGDSLFLSGTGGSLRYGMISDRISRDIGFHRPLVLAWRSRDYYLGRIHRAALHELMRTYSLIPRDILAGSLLEKIAEERSRISQNLALARQCADQKKIKYWTGMQGSAANLAVFIHNMFTATPSCFDLLANFDRHEIVNLWEQAILTPEIRKTDSIHQIHADILYAVPQFHDLQPADLPELYRQIGTIGVD